MWLKVCGITRRADAEAAVAAGAGALGFVFREGSPRRVDAGAARSIGSDLPGEVERAGVFVDAGRDEIRRTFDEAGLTWVQLHGSEDLAFARSLGVPWVKALRARADLGPEALQAFGREALGGRCLVDAFVEGVPGGTGRTFDWGRAAGLRRAGSPVRLILAGGLTPANVGEAVARARPWGVDVSGGVESAPGVKDAAKIAAFARALREAEVRAAAGGGEP